MADVLGTSGVTANDTVQTSGGQGTRFTGSGWLNGSNFELDYGKLYKIYVANDVTVEIQGEPSNATILSLVSGWNWIANPLTEAVTPAQLTHSGGWTAGDRIVGSGGAAVTYTGSKWIGNSGFTLLPGKGYQIFSQMAGNVTFGN